MSSLRRIVLIRHGETDGESSIRYHGATDVPLSDLGRTQMATAQRRLRGQRFDTVVASPLRRSWQAAAIVADGQLVRLDPDLREVDFGRWEGLTREEIQAADPVLYEDWQSGAEGFAYPGGESRADFAERVGRGLERLRASGAGSALVVVHKGVVRVFSELLTGEGPPPDEPGLGESLVLTRDGDGSWFQGSRSSNPESLAEIG